MTVLTTGDKMNAQLQNWHNFCHYHIGNWYGVSTTYSSQGEKIKAFKCIRSFQLSIDESEIHHTNKYIYADGEIKEKKYGPYRKPVTRGLYLENSFSWGATTVEAGTSFFFEIGFRYENRRVSAVLIYETSGRLESIITFSEHLASFVEGPPLTSANQLSSNCQGILRRMTPDWTVSPIVVTTGMLLGDLNKNYLTFHFNEGLSVSLPQNVEIGKDFFIAVDWLVNPTLLQRGIRYFSGSEFTAFTLETLAFEV